MSDNINEILKKPIRYVKGIGDSRAKLFNRLNIFSVEDMITYFPRDYEDRTSIKKIAELENGETCAFIGTVVSKVTENRPRKGLTIQKLNIRDNTGMITATWFNQNYLKNNFHPGESYVFHGKISRRYWGLEVNNPVYDKIDSGRMKNTCRIFPVYASTANLSQNVIRASINNAIELVDGKLEDTLPTYLREKYHLSEINYSVKNIHFPTSDVDFKNARYRLAFEELLLLQLGLLSIKHTLGENKEGIKFKAGAETRDFIKSLPFTLTRAQIKVLAEIEKDMESNNVMNRLLQGDVGSGKTIIAVLALYKAVKSGYQGAMMVPTEILAEQHYNTILELFKNTGIKVSLLTGSITAKSKRELLKEISEGETDIVIGTHALIEDNVQFQRLGLVVTDEQHRFGVRQRAVLSQKGSNPDMLVMTATPIPRTLALILYGDLDISIIDELPPGRKPIKTYEVDESMRDRINAFIRKKVREGRQVYIVCPLIEESETVGARSALELYEEMAKKDFSDLKVGLMHGKMKSTDKDKMMKEFVEGRIDILVSTTVIEVGVNVPNATLMVVENAERFGLAQLHQLRGRVGRGEHQSYCILYNQSKTDISKERMKVMEKTGDGFVISEKDMELRGPGEFFGTRQHGIPDLKIANLYKDIEILKTAQQAAFEILEEDRQLKKDKNRKLRDTLLSRFEGKLKELSLN